MFKKVLWALCIAGVSFSSWANWVSGVNYINLSDEGEGSNVSLNGMSASIGYKFSSEDQLYFLPEFRVGTGIGDDTTTISSTEVTFEIDHFMVLSVRAQYESSNSIYFFIAPSYANLELTAEASGYESQSDDDWKFGLGGGLGYRFNNKLSAEFSYDQYDEADVINAGIKYSF